MDEKRLGDLVEHFYRAFLAADREALDKVVAPKATWIVQLDTASPERMWARTASLPCDAKSMN